MLTGCKLQLCRTQHHLAHNAIGIGARNTVFDGRIAQSLDRHGDKRRGATAHGTAHKQQTRIELDHRAKLSEQTEHRGTLLIAKRGSLLAGDNALAHRNRRVGHRRDVRDTRQDLLPLGTIPSPGDRKDNLVGKGVLERSEDLLNHVRLYRRNYDIGRGDNLRRIVASSHAPRLATLDQSIVAACAGTHVARGCAGGNPAIGHSARHIAKTDKSDLHITQSSQIRSSKTKAIVPRDCFVLPTYL